MNKTKAEVLDQYYLTPKDIKVLIPDMNIERCREIIEDVRIEMTNKNLYVPPGTKPRRALTSLVRKKLGI